VLGLGNLRPGHGVRESGILGWMEDCSLHPLDLEFVQRYVAALNSADVTWDGAPWSANVIDRARNEYVRAKEGNENSAIAVGFGLAQLLTQAQPTFFQSSLSFTTWEARIDRGIGMLIRPPSRFFSEAGLDQQAARAMPIRLDVNRGTMAGAFVPASLIDQLDEYLNTRLERIVKRMIHAELDAIPAMAQMFEAVKYAQAHGLGLYEAVDVISPSAPNSLPPGATVIEVDRKHIEPNLKKRLELAAKPTKQPNRLSRLIRRGR
jgi:hypothetical protein